MARPEVCLNLKFVGQFSSGLSRLTRSALNVLYPGLSPAHLKTPTGDKEDGDENNLENDGPSQCGFT